MGRSLLDKLPRCTSVDGPALAWIPSPTSLLTLALLPMTVPALLLPEFDQEMKTTRRVLERVPGDKDEWRPHPKSFPIAHLAQLLAGMPDWITQALRDTKIDLSKGPGYSFQKTETLLEQFDRNVEGAREALRTATESDFAVMWSLTMGDRVLITMPRADMVRQTISHLSHHRGQMTVYLRLLDIPVPCVYGPTADEQW